MDLRMITERRLSGTLTRFWSYQVASVLPSRASTRVRWASGSAVRDSGSLLTVSATPRALTPMRAANGSTRPATRMPITTASTSITPRSDMTLAADTRRARMPAAYGSTEGQLTREIMINNTHVISEMHFQD